MVKDFTISVNNRRCVRRVVFHALKIAHRTGVNNVSSRARLRPMNKRSAPRFSSRRFVPINRITRTRQSFLPMIVNDRSYRFTRHFPPIAQRARKYLLGNCENDLSNSLIWQKKRRIYLRASLRTILQTTAVQTLRGEFLAWTRSTDRALLCTGESPVE